MIKFKLTIKLTTTKIIAWVILILSFCVLGLIPENDRAMFILGIGGIVCALYGIKNVQSYLNNKINPEIEEGPR